MVERPTELHLTSGSTSFPALSYLGEPTEYELQKPVTPTYPSHPPPPMPNCSIFCCTSMAPYVMQTCGCPLCGDHLSIVMRSSKSISSDLNRIECISCFCKSTVPANNAIGITRMEPTYYYSYGYPYYSVPQTPIASPVYPVSSFPSPVVPAPSLRRTVSTPILSTSPVVPNANSSGNAVIGVGLSKKLGSPMLKKRSISGSGSRTRSISETVLHPNARDQRTEATREYQRSLVQLGRFGLGCESRDMEGFPVVKVENIPFSLTTGDIERWLPADFTPKDIWPLSVHFILHRKSLRTLPHLYIQVRDVDLGAQLIRAKDRSKLGDRTVRVKWERNGEIWRDLFSQEAYFSLPSPTGNPASAPLPPVPINGFSFSPNHLFFTQEDADLIRNACGLSGDIISEDGYPQERPFLHVSTLILKFPWHLFTEPISRPPNEPQLLFDCARDVLKHTLAKSGAHMEHRDFFGYIARVIYLSMVLCDGFTHAQKSILQPLVEEYGERVDLSLPATSLVFQSPATHLNFRQTRARTLSASHRPTHKKSLQGLQLKNTLGLDGLTLSDPRPETDQAGKLSISTEMPNIPKMPYTPTTPNSGSFGGKPYGFHYSGRSPTHHAHPAYAQTYSIPFPGSNIGLSLPPSPKREKSPRPDLRESIIEEDE